MLVLGLAGPLRVGKDTVAKFLCANLGFMPFSFSDQLYREVAGAFRINEMFLRADATKEKPTYDLSLDECDNADFRSLAAATLCTQHGGAGQATDDWLDAPLSPRWILQTWGTEYRRAQDPDYWVKAAQQWLLEQRGAYRFPEQAPQYFVNTSVRFPNEQQWIHSIRGNVWHIRRGAAPKDNTHIAERGLPVLPNERVLYNNDTIDRLYRIGLPALLNSNSDEVHVLPMEESAAGGA